mgnify:CR=1 FL=1
MIIEYFLTFREQTGRKSEVIEVEEGATVGNLLNRVADKYGEEFRDALLDRGGNLREYVRILIDGRDVQGLDDLSTKLHANCTVSIFPPVGGGRSQKN